MAEAKVEFDDKLFCTRLKQLYQAWKDNSELFGGATALIIAAGSSSQELRYLKSGALQLWLFAYELPDTVLGFTQQSLHVLTSGKKAKYLEGLAKAAEAETDITIHFLIKPKGEDGQAQAEELLQAVQPEGAVVGTLPKDHLEGQFAGMFAKVLAAACPNPVDVSGGMSELLSCKDPEEVKKVKKAAFLAATVLQKYAVPQFEGIIDEELQTKHSKLSQKIEDVITQPEKELSIRLRPENCDIAYPPIIQSGGEYSLKLSAQSAATPLKYDVILCGIGARYSMYCANVARTVLVDPNKQQEAEYKALLAAQEAAIAALVPGALLSAPVDAAVQALKDKDQERLIEKLPKALGFGMGLEFRESSLLISSKSQHVIKAGMVFNVSLGVQDLRRTDPNEGQAEVYALQLADTVLVQPEGTAPEVLTTVALKGWTDVAYYFKEEEDSKPEAPPTPTANGLNKEAKLRSKDETFKAQELARQKQRDNQEDLLSRVNDETRRMLQQKQEGADGAGGQGRKVSDTCAYSSVADMPAPRDLAIQVDQRTESVLLPIYGIMVPFHILTIKNATNNQDNDHAYIRINFNFGTGYEPSAKFPSAIFLKELSFRSSDTRRAAKVVQEIKMLRGSVSQREKEKAERATLVQQERLIRGAGRSPHLPDVWIRPNFGGKGRKMTGQLEAHQNGFRYSSPKGETLDVMYRNIKHAFFQPADKKELLTLVHFRLHNSIMVGKKKTEDVQFYTEVGEAAQTLDGGRHSMYDPDEIEEEQREKQVRRKINQSFQRFVKSVHTDIWEKHFRDQTLEFEIPYRDLGFNGVPHKSTSYIMPTVNCLVELTEPPFTVITMADVGIVNLERVGFNLRNFDMTLVYKDLTRDVMRIDAIPSTSLDMLKGWLSQVNLKFYESKINLNWKPILKNIIEDPDAFFENGGWSFLDQEGGSDEEDVEEEDEADPEFQGSDEDEDESEDDDSSEDESVVDSEEAEAEDDEDFSEGDEEEGKDWEELEEEAIQADKIKQSDSDDETDRKRKRKGGSSAAMQKRGRR